MNAYTRREAIDNLLREAEVSIAEIIAPAATANAWSAIVASLRTLGVEDSELRELTWFTPIFDSLKQD